MATAKKNHAYFTWGCADDLTCRLKKTLYCSDDDDCYKSSSVALTDVVVSMFTEAAPCPRRKLKHQYASSLVRQLSLTPCALMLGILYSERLRQSKPSYRERVSSSDLYVISLLVASKFLHDEGEAEEIFNEEWAEAAGLSVKTVNRLEREFLDVMDWNVYATPMEFLDVCARVETKIALQYGLRRGWFSYTDLTQFLLASNYPNLLSGVVESVVKIIGGCVLMYGMSLSILTSSMMCFVANNNALKANVPKFSCNNTSSMAMNDRTFTDRYLTRRRTVQPEKNITDNMEQVTEGVLANTQVFERLHENQTMNTLDTSSNNNQQNIELRDPCFCKRNDHLLCFESRFRHLTHQTRLGFPLDPDLSNHFCDETFLVSHDSCQCADSLNNGKLGFRIGMKTAKSHQLETAASRHLHSRNLMLNPSILGMMVM